MKNLWITKGTLSSIDQKNKYIYRNCNRTKNVVKKRNCMSSLKSMENP